MTAAIEENKVLRSALLMIRDRKWKNGRLTEFAKSVLEKKEIDWSLVDVSEKEKPKYDPKLNSGV